jgi:tetratricopeptide (TPR) repeat protein
MKKTILFLFVTLFTISCSHAPRQKSNFEIGFEFLQKNRVQASIPYLEKAVIDEPDNIKALNQLGYVYFLTGRFYKAMECFDKSIAINPNDSYAWKWKGETLNKLGMEAEGKELYNKGIELEKIEKQNKDPKKK